MINEGKHPNQIESDQKAIKKLIIASSVSVFFLAVQLVGGYLASSIAIFTDSAHLASDMLGFAISIIALKISQKSSDTNLTYGWHRAEIIGTLISMLSIWVITAVLVIEATRRFFEPSQVNGGIMLIVAVLGLLFNLIQMRILHTGDGHYHLHENN
jgi:zinc transporter 2